MEEKHDSSTNVDGALTGSPISSGEFHGSVSYNYNIANYAQQQLAEEASQFKSLPKPSIFRGESSIFIGRKEDIAKIKQRLTTESRKAPMSIVGEGGIGKSALAFKAIHECEDMFDVIIPIYFESVLTFNSFLLEIAKSLQLHISIDKSEQLDNAEEKSDIVRNALAKYRSVLIYADNYETVKNSITSIITTSPGIEQSSQREDAKKINSFLNSLPKNASVLLTSRQRNNLTRERTIPLEGLSTQEGYELFIEVAGDKLPKKIPVEMKEVIEEISGRTGGHPLSIEILASTYVGDLLPELRQMVEHLGARVINLEQEEKSRHRSLEACFEYSISKLPESHKLLLPKLTIMFKSSFSGSAVEYIFGRGDGGVSARTAAATAFDIVRDLHNSSLLRRIDFDDYGDIEGKYRLYHFHPSVRNYLDHKQEEGNKGQQELEEEYGEQFSIYYYKLIEEAYNAIGTKDRVLSLERFNVIFSQGKDNDFERSITLAKNRSVAGAISTDLGLILYILGRYTAAIEYHNKALAIHQELQDKLGIARDYINIGNVLDKQGNYAQALEYHKKALTIDEELQDKVGMAKAYNNTGVVLQAQGSYVQTLEYQKKALAIHEEFQDRVETARDYTNIGLVLKNQGNYPQALEYHNKALAIHQDLQDRVGMAIDYNNIATVLRKQGNYPQALEYQEKALAIDEELQDRVGMAIDYNNIATVLRKQGKYDQALEYHKKALAIDEELQDRVGTARDYTKIGLVFKEQGNYPQALEYQEKALAIDEELQDRVGMAADYNNIGIVLANIENYKAASESLSKGLDILQELEEKTGYHHPLSDTIQSHISRLHDKR